MSQLVNKHFNICDTAVQCNCVICIMTVCPTCFHCLHTAMCQDDITAGNYGRYIWLATGHSVRKSLACVYGAVSDAEGGMDAQGLAHRWCNISNNAVLWQEPDYSQCRVVSYCNLIPFDDWYIGIFRRCHILVLKSIQKCTFSLKYQSHFYWFFEEIQVRNMPPLSRVQGVFWIVILLFILNTWRTNTHETIWH